MCDEKKRKQNMVVIWKNEMSGNIAVLKTKNGKTTFKLFKDPDAAMKKVLSILK